MIKFFEKIKKKLHEANLKSSVASFKYDLRPEIFVFGSNTIGVHGAGAAKAALDNYGARWGIGEGHNNYCYALPTKNHSIETLPLDIIREKVGRFITYAGKHPEYKFKVTCVGCGLAGLKHEDIAPMFKDAPENCYFDTLWFPWLKNTVKYWGSF